MTFLADFHRENNVMTRSLKGYGSKLENGTYTNQSYHTAHDKSSLKGDKNGGLRPDLRSSLIVCTKMGATHVLWLLCVHCDTEYST